VDLAGAQRLAVHADEERAARATDEVLANELGVDRLERPGLPQQLTPDRVASRSSYLGKGIRREGESPEIYGEEPIEVSDMETQTENLFAL
jgi:hypothetical protein